jgi:hypothetical protein
VLSLQDRTIEVTDRGTGEVLFCVESEHASLDSWSEMVRIGGPDGAHIWLAFASPSTVASLAVGATIEPTLGAGAIVAQVDTARASDGWLALESWAARNGLRFDASYDRRAMVVLYVLTAPLFAVVALLLAMFVVAPAYVGLAVPLTAGVGLLLVASVAWSYGALRLLVAGWSLLRGDLSPRTRGRAFAPLSASARRTWLGAMAVCAAVQVAVRAFG